MLESMARRLERALASERTDMQRIENAFMPGTTDPTDHLPLVSGRVDDLARSMNVLRLESRGGVRNSRSVWKHEAIRGTRSCIMRTELVPATLARCQWVRSRSVV